MMGEIGYDMTWWMWLAMGAATLSFWVVIALALRSLLTGREKVLDPHRPDPLTLLKQRLASGEVTAEEYEQRRRLLIDGH